MKLREFHISKPFSPKDAVDWFRTTFDRLKEGEMVRLVVHSVSADSLNVVLAHPRAQRIHTLEWAWDSQKNMSPVIPLLAQCHGLVTLQLENRTRVSEFVADLLQCGSRIRTLTVTLNVSVPRFFEALSQSQVRSLTIKLDDYKVPLDCLRTYLKKDLLTRLELCGLHSNQAPTLLSSLAQCTELRVLSVWGMVRERPLELLEQWSYCKLTGLVRLSIIGCPFVNELLAVTDLGGITALVARGDLNDASVAQIASAVVGGQMLQLYLNYHPSFHARLSPSLRHPGCALIKLELPSRDMIFCLRLGVFALLYGQQVKKPVKKPLRRLPVEMLRLVGQMLLT